ncbi:DUF6197 family protein [Rhizobium arsenicireducens]
MIHKALDLIRDPDNWTRQTRARNAAGNPVQPEDKSAKSFCSIGAMYRVGMNLQERRAAAELIHPRLQQFNDTHTHAEVMEVWNRALQN